MLHYKVFAWHVFEVEFELRVAKRVLVLGQRVVFGAGNQDFEVDLFAHRAFLLTHLDSLSKDTAPAADIVPALADCVIFDVLCAYQALLDL